MTRALIGLTLAALFTAGAVYLALVVLLSMAHYIPSLP